MPEDLENNAEVMASIREGFRLDAVRIDNVCFLDKYAKDCAPHILSFADPEYADMVVANRGDTDTGTNYNFKNSIENHIYDNEVRYDSEPMETNVEEQPEGLPRFKKPRLCL